MEKSLFTKNKVYEIAYSLKNSYVRKDLDDSVAKQFVDAMNYLQSFSNVCIYVNCLKESIKELNGFLTTLSFKKNNYIDFANVHRLTLNMLNHFYSFIKYCEANVIQFKNTIAPAVYDNFFAYRLFYNMRNFLTHSKLGITTFQSTFKDGDFYTEALFDLRLMIKDKQTNSRFKSELIALNKDKISIASNIKEFIAAVNKEIFDIFRMNSLSIVNSFTFLRKTIDEDCNGDINTSFKDPEGVIHGPFKSLNIFLTNFSNEIVYSNGIENNPDIDFDIYSLFRVLNFLYFKNDGVVVVPLNSNNPSNKEIK